MLVPNEFSKVVCCCCRLGHKGMKGFAAGMVLDHGTTTTTPAPSSSKRRSTECHLSLSRKPRQKYRQWSASPSPKSSWYMPHTLGSVAMRRWGSKSTREARKATLVAWIASSSPSGVSTGDEDGFAAELLFSKKLTRG